MFDTMAVAVALGTADARADPAVAALESAASAVLGEDLPAPEPGDPVNGAAIFERNAQPVTRWTAATRAARIWMA